MQIIFSYPKVFVGYSCRYNIGHNEVHAKAERSVPTCHKNSRLHSLFSANFPAPQPKEVLYPLRKREGITTYHAGCWILINSDLQIQIIVLSFNWNFTNNGELCCNVPCYLFHKSLHLLIIMQHLDCHISWCIHIQNFHTITGQIINIQSP